MVYDGVSDVLVVQFFLELIPDVIPHARPGAVAKLPNAG